MSQITLIFIRHGEAASSWVSHEDPGLSIKGQNEAKALLTNKDLQNLENYEFISSPRKRAIATSKPLAAKFNKKIFIDKTFNEIPSSNIENSKKQKWLEDIIKIDKKELPQKIIDWEKAIFDKVLTAEKNTVIFSHFMVINSIVSNLIKSNSIFYFYPDNTSITKIFLEKGKVVSFQIGNDKKTHINL